jgi:hypothetical protein
VLSHGNTEMVTGNGPNIWYEQEYKGYGLGSLLGPWEE